MSELPIPPSPNGSTASFPSNLEDTTDTLGPRSFPFDDQFVSNAPLYTNDSNGPRWNDSNALVSDPLLYENLSLPFAIDMHPPIEPQTQRTDQIPPFPATTGSSIGLQDAYQEYEFLSENVLSEWAPGVDGPIDTYCPTQLAVDDQCPASDHTKAAVTSNGPTDPAQKTRKRSSDNAESLSCDWPGCDRSQPFNRLQDLRRHRKCLHESPGSHVCPFDGCHKPHNRKDNLQEHIRQHHRKATNADDSPRGS